MFVQETESVTSVVTDDENSEMSEVYSQRDVMSINDENPGLQLTQDDEYQNSVNSKENVIEPNPECEVSEAYTDAHLFWIQNMMKLI